MNRRQYPSAARARAQIIRHDLPGYTRYRAELQYRHYRPRAVIGFTNAYSVVDEAYEKAAEDVVERFSRAFRNGARHADWVAKQCDEQLGKTYRCACGDVWPDGTLGVGHTYVQCAPDGG
ncbi:hypothetical protein ACFYRN_23235 [Streptomyces sp. NPDC005227]|uniref:hypothetical protein n=1 Tax=Streptomyces sp. NPDC005227 TaxID=3364707 RepID=UPI0036912C46